MKSIVKLSLLGIVLLLGSCQTMKWGNFNKQKFTRLKTIKVEDSPHYKSEQDQEGEVLDNNKKENNQSQSKILDTDNYPIQGTTSEIEDSVAQETERQLLYAESHEEEIIINVNGKNYYLANWYFKKEEKKLYGNLIGTENLPKNSSVLELKAGKYDILLSNKLMINLDQITVLNPRKIQLPKEIVTTNNDLADEPESDNLSSDTLNNSISEGEPISIDTTENGQEKFKRTNKNKGVALIFTALILALAAGLLGGPIGIAFIIFALIMLIAALITFSKKNFEPGPEKKKKISKSTTQNISPDYIRRTRQKAHRTFGGSLICLLGLIAAIFIGINFWHLFVFAWILGGIFYVVGYSLLITSALNSRRYKNACQSAGKPQDNRTMLIRGLTWAGLFGFGLPIFLIPFFIAIGIVRNY